MFAIIETGGKQYLVEEGKKIKTEKIEGKPGERVNFDRVLLIADNNKVEIGKPYLKGHSVEAEVLKTGRSKKIIVFRYHNKTRYRKKKSHRQWLTELKIIKIK